MDVPLQGLFQRLAPRARTARLALRQRLQQAAGRVRGWQVFVVALALRLPLVWMRPPPYHSENIRAGLTLARYGYLGDPFAIPTGPTAHVAPAYPTLIAAVRSLAPSDADCLLVCSLILAVVSAANVAALVPVARSLRLPRAVGWLATAIFLVPWFAFVEVSGEHETPLTVAALLGLLSVIARSMRSGPPSMFSAAGLGVATGLAAYFTPLALPVAACASLAVLPWRAWRPRQTLTVLGGAALLCLLTIAPYTLRNHRDLGGWILMRDNLGIELAVSNGPGAGVTKEQNRPYFLQHHPFVRVEQARLIRRLGEVAYNRRLERTTFAWIDTHPQLFFRLFSQRAEYLVFPYTPRWYQRLIGGFVSVLAVAGCLLLWRSRYQFGVRCLAGALIGYLPVYLLVEHDIRYLYPAMFLESLLAGCCVLALRHVWRHGSLEPGSRPPQLQVSAARSAP